MSKIPTDGSLDPVRQPNAAQNNEHSRVREPVSRSKGRVVGIYCSVKNKRGVAWESQLERNACCLFEFSRSVLQYREQPITVWLPSKVDKLRKYTPDFLLKDTTGRLTYVEVKPLSKLSDQDVRATLLAASEYFSKRGHNYVVLTDAELNQPIVIQNLTVLKASLRCTIEHEQLQIITEAFKQHRKITLGKLIQLTGNAQLALSLIAHQHLTVDLCEPLTHTTPLKLNLETSHENYLFKGRFAPDFE